MRRGRAAAAGCSPPNRGGPPELNDTGPPRAQRPPSVVTTSWSRPMAGHHPGDRPGRPAGPVSTFSIPHSPATRPAPWPWASARVGPAARRRRSRDAGQAAALGYGRHSCQPATANAAPSPSGQARCRQATTPPADHGARGTWTRCARPGRPATPSHSRSSAARTGRRQRRGHQRPVRPDTWRPRTPGHRTPERWTSARPVGRTSHGGPDEADRQRPAWPASEHPRGRRPPAGRPDLARVTAPGALGHPRRLRGDGTGAAALTAAATGQLPAPPGMRPRPGALLSLDDFGSSVERRSGCHPVYSDAWIDRGLA
jgi:hypothetical protein